MTIYDVILWAIPQEMAESMGECAYQRLLFCSGLFSVLLPYILAVGFAAWLMLNLFGRWYRK